MHAPQKASFCGVIGLSHNFVEANGFLKGLNLALTKKMVAQGARQNSRPTSHPTSQSMSESIAHHRSDAHPIPKNRASPNKV